MSNRLYDSTAAMQVIGCAIKNPNLLDSDGIYFFNQEDFVTDLHRVIFSSIFNLRQMGTQTISIKVIEDYLNNGHLESYGIYKASNGAQWLEQVIQNADLPNFDYNYNRLKKYTLLREYDKIGINCNWLYDPDNILDPTKKEQQEEYFDSLSLEEISNLVNNKVLDVKDCYVDNISNSYSQIGEGIDELFDSLFTTPDIGAPFQDKIFNTVTRGARLGKYYLRSAPTGVGKSRMMLADMLYIAANKIYDTYSNSWKDNGESWPSLFISTELELEEIQMMCVAFLSGISEQKIRTGEIKKDNERIKTAIEILKQSPLYIEILPDFNVKDVENTIKRNIRINKVQYVAFDYINSSLGLLSEMSQKTRGVNMREDNILFLLSTRLKELAVEFNIFIESGTQTNAKLCIGNNTLSVYQRSNI